MLHMSEPTPHPGVLKITPYVSGESCIPGVDVVAKLSANENPLGPSPRAVAAYSAAADGLHRYPDPHATALRRALGRLYNLDHDRIICGCGSDDILSLLGHAYAGPGDEIIYSQHGFLLYALITHSVGATPVVASESEGLRTSVNDVLEKVTSRTRIVYIANPNNPTGTYLPACELTRLHQNLPSYVLLVIDAAYAEYVGAKDYTAGIELVDSGANVVMTRTFSKLYGLAALRLGWAYGPPAVIEALNRVRMPFNVSTPAQAAGIAALEDTAYTISTCAHNEKWRSWVTARLRALNFVMTESVTNFVLTRFPIEQEHNSLAADTFLRRFGLIARRMESYKLPQWLRISIGRDSDMHLLVNSLTEFVNNKDAP